MSHPDEETLVAFALGEEVDADVAGHVDECASCRTEVRGTADVVRATEALSDTSLALEEPPDRVWAAINDELASDRRRPAAGVKRPASYLPLPKELRPARPWWRSPQAAVATVAGIAVGVAAVLLVLFVSPSPKPAVTEPLDLLAAGRLVPLKGETANGSAQVYDRNGERTVTVRLRDAAVDTDEYVEAWIFEPGTSKMVSLGVMDQDTQTFSVPSGLNIEVYSAIDISAEPLNGDPAHSTKSMARGELESLNDGPQASGATSDRRPQSRARAGMYDAETRSATRRYLLNFPGLDNEQPVDLQASGVEAGQRHQTTLASTRGTGGGLEPAAQASAEPTATSSAEPSAGPSAGPSAKPAARPAAELTPTSGPRTGKGGSPTATPTPGAVTPHQAHRTRTCRAKASTQAGTQADPFGVRHGEFVGLGGVVEEVLREVGLVPRPAAAAQQKQCRRTGSAGLSGQATPRPSAVAEDRPAPRASAAAPSPSPQARKVVRPADQQVRKPSVRKPVVKRQPGARAGVHKLRGGHHPGQPAIGERPRPQPGFWFGGWFS